MHFKCYVYVCVKHYLQFLTIRYKIIEHNKIEIVIKSCFQTIESKTLNEF